MARRRKARRNTGERWIVEGWEVRFPDGGVWAWHYYVTVRGKNLTKVAADRKMMKKMGLPPGAMIIGMRVPNTAENLAKAHKHEKIGYHPLGKHFANPTKALQNPTKAASRRAKKRYGKKKFVTVTVGRPEWSKGWEQEEEFEATSVADAKKQARAKGFTVRSAQDRGMNIRSARWHGEHDNPTKARRNGFIHTPMTLTQQQGFTVHEGGGLVHEIRGDHELPDEKVVWLEVTSSSGEPGRVYVRSVLDPYGSWSAVEGVFYGDKGGGDDPSDLPAWVTRRKWTRYA